MVQNIDYLLSDFSKKFFENWKARSDSEIVKKKANA
jgi:hypothetical protein